MRHLIEAPRHSLWTIPRYHYTACCEKVDGRKPLLLPTLPCRRNSFATKAPIAMRSTIVNQYWQVGLDSKDPLERTASRWRYHIMDATETLPPVRRGSVNTDNSTTKVPTKTKLTLSSSLRLLYIENTKSGKDRGFDRRDIWLKVTFDK
jgi:hypothetical protein